MPREVTDGEGTTWTCTQAYAGLSDAGEDETKDDAARVEGTDRYRVVCTPSGGERTVELELPAGWEESCPDEEILEAIRSRLG